MVAGAITWVLWASLNGNKTVLLISLVTFYSYALYCAALYSPELLSAAMPVPAPSAPSWRLPPSQALILIVEKG